MSIRLSTQSWHDVAATFRYLEGNVEPDCSIDAIDAQAISFRWGVEKGSLIYSEFMNLEPSGAQQDEDIGISDLHLREHVRRPTPATAAGEPERLNEIGHTMRS